MATPLLPVQFGALLRRYRKAAGLTQEELAEKAGMSAHGIADLESGRRRFPRKDTVTFLAEALGLTGPDRSALTAAAHRTTAAVMPRGTVGLPQGGLNVYAAHPDVGLVGRAAEVACIDRHLSGAGASLLIFAGEPGIGKSRLLREAGLRAPGLGWEVLAGGCHRRSGEEPFTPLLTALKRHLSQQTHMQLRGCDWLARLLPELTETGALTGPRGSLPPEQERRLMFAAVGRYLSNTAGPRGTVLVLDDLQWAGVDALDLLAALLRAPTTTPLRIVAAYRDTETHKHDPLPHLLADLAYENRALRVVLGPLSMHDATTLLDDVLPDTSAASAAHTDLKSLLVMRADGIPYYLISCAQAIADGVLAAPDVVTGLPASVANVIRQRVGALSSETQRLLDVAATIGRDVPRTLVFRVLGESGQSDEMVLASLEAACAARLLSEAGEGAYQFAHDLVREVVSSDLSTARRALLHRQVAEALEREPGERAVELLADHYGQSGDSEKAVIYLERAGARAEARHALADAQNRYQDLARQLSGLGRDVDAAAVRLRLGAVLQVQARYDEALRMFEQAADAYRTAMDAEGQRLAAARIGELQAHRGSSQEGLARLQSALLASRDAKVPSPGLAALHLSLSHLYFVGGAYREQLHAATRAKEIAQAVADDQLLRLAEYGRASALLALGQVDEGHQVLVEHVIPLAEASGDLHILAHALTQVGALHGVYWANFVEERQYIERAVTITERTGEPTELALLTYRRGCNAFSVGDWLQAREHFEHAVALMRQVDRAWPSAYPPLGLGQLHLAKGNWEAATHALDEAVALAEQSRDLQALRWVHGPLAERELLQGRPEAARDRLTALLARMGAEMPQPAPILTLLAWTDLERGEIRQAETTLAEIIARATAGGERAVLPDALRVQAIAYTRRSRWSEATDVLARALDLSRAIQAPYAEAKVLCHYGQLLAAQGMQVLARERWEDALSILNRLGERLYAEHVERALIGLVSR
jgi:tetratricopeptide (TPR) repeat protein/DNA-binding XRE family transcriptional regulator